MWVKLFVGSKRVGGLILPNFSLPRFSLPRGIVCKTGSQNIGNFFTLTDVFIFTFLALSPSSNEAHSSRKCIC